MSDAPLNFNGIHSLGQPAQFKSNDYLTPDGSLDFSPLTKPAINPVTGVNEIDALKLAGLDQGIKNPDGSVFQSKTPGADDMSFLTQYNDQIQVGLQGLNALSGLVQSYTGIKQLGYAKDALKEGRRQFDLNFGAQRKLTNSRLEDRQKIRIANSEGSGHFTPTDEYMAKYGV